MKKSNLKNRKWMLYGMCVLALIVANIWRWQSVTTAAEDVFRAEREQALSQLPVLLAAKDFEEIQNISRDLFQIHRTTKPPASPPIKVATQPTQPDPMDLLRKRANTLLDTVEVQGIISSPNGLIALLQFDGTLFTLSSGEEFIPGYTIAEISTTQLRVVNEILDIQRIYTVGEAGLE